MNTVSQILIFTLCVLGGYAWFSNSIPQMRSVPPVEEEILLEGLTPESFASLGKKLFFGKANCALCHNDTGRRAPVLEKASIDGPHVMTRAVYRLKDPRYKGEATSVDEYIMESFLKPSAFVVKGFGKTGTGDTVSPMQSTSVAPMNLSQIENDAILAFLQQSAGLPITVALPMVDLETAWEKWAVDDSQPVTTIERFVEKYECRICHFIPGIGMNPEETDLGMPLQTLARFAKEEIPGGLTLKEYIKESILNPNAYIPEGYDSGSMPDDYSARIPESELEMAVNYFAQHAGDNK